VIAIYVHRNGETRQADQVDPDWLTPVANVTLWVDVSAPGPDDSRILSDVFRFHPLSVEDALSEIHHPKIESYDGYLYLVLHGIDFQETERHFATHDIDFFLGRNYLVTVHDGTSRSIVNLRAVCDRHGHVLAEGPVGALHRIVDALVDHYRPEVEEFERRISELEELAFTGRQEVVRELLALKRDLAWMRRVIIPQRDAVGRLARREFAAISDEMAYRFRDVHDGLVRLAEEGILFQDRVTGILDAHLTIVSNRLNQVMKLLTVMATIFLPLGVLSGLYGMNVPLPSLPGGDAVQFWWIVGIMAGIALLMVGLFRRVHWI
jgi:magnesium transporter